ncbi:hypothetical protein [Edaphobacter modestus]|uniref:Uncharacterized protein n=1 Tax=Edaphobacter modestus TaxID=388466 RepID=A0A4Q7XYC9_9BACT|nr:hypothetical protein [Edaphobacter modestus]RZU28934.1 hypothetical protein BDD14_6519 [Edaphobacter modestus]
MADDVFYRGELNVTPPLTKRDAKVLGAVMNLQRTAQTKAVFKAIEGSPDPDLPYYGGLLEVSEDRSRLIPEEGESRHGLRLWLSHLLKHFFRTTGILVEW